MKPNTPLFRKREPLLQVEDLSVKLDKSSDKIHTSRVLDSVSFDINSGEIIGIIGEAGSGKTVLSRALVNGLVDPLSIEKGRVNFKGQDLLTMSQRDLRKIRGNSVAYIGSNPGGSLDPTLPIGAQIVEKLLSVQPKYSAKAAKEKVIEVLSSVRIPSPEIRFHEYPLQFSGGMMQRVMIVDALVSNPDFLVADNITQALDVTVAAQIISLIDELRTTYNTAIVFISSSLPVVTSIADKILVLQEGKVVERAKPSDLVNFPQQPYTKNLLKRLPKIWGSDIGALESKKSPSLLKVNGVSKTYKVPKKNSFSGYNYVKAVRELSLEVRKGENFGIVGESGCGKSTLTRLLAWLEKPDTGTIEFEGKDLYTLTPKRLVEMRQSFQLLLQDPYSSLPANISIGRIIAEPLLIHKSYDKDELHQRVLATMKEVGLDVHLENQLTVGLSAGQRQRINIARALMLKPKLLILDETLSALDQVEQSRLLDLFDRLQKKHGFTYIFISHDMALVRKVCHRIAVMYLGKVVELANNETLFERPGHPYSKALLSAVPTLDEHPYSADNYLLEGEPPSPVDIPEGCSFCSRCPVSISSCQTTSPTTVKWSDEGQIACHLVGDQGELSHISLYAKTKENTHASST